MTWAAEAERWWPQVRWWLENVIVVAEWNLYVMHDRKRGYHTYIAERK
jgi:hypothetical protein